MHGAAALPPQPRSEPGSSQSPSAKRRQNNSERGGCAGLALLSVRAKLACKVTQLLPPRAKGIRLERSNKVPSPTPGSSSRQGLRGVKQALERSAASLGAIFLAVFKKMRRNDMGNVRNKARSN